MNKETKIILGIYLFAILIAVIILANSCSPVKQVKKDHNKVKEVFEYAILTGLEECVNDTIINSKSDTTIVSDTLYSIDYLTDTVNNQVIKEVTKFINKTVTVRDTFKLVVTDKTKENILVNNVAEITSQKVKIENDLIAKEVQLKEMKQKKNRWAFRFWLLIVLAAIVIFRKPIGKLLVKIISPFKHKL